MGLAAVQARASGGSNWTASTCACKLRARDYGHSSSSAGSLYPAASVSHRMHIVSTHLYTAPIRERFACSNSAIEWPASDRRASGLPCLKSRTTSHFKFNIARPTVEVTALCWHLACSLLPAFAHVLSQDIATKCLSPEMPCACQATSSNPGCTVFTKRNNVQVWAPGLPRSCKSLLTAAKEKGTTRSLSKCTHTNSLTHTSTLAAWPAEWLSADATIADWL